MLFNSLEFFLFLPIVFLLYWFIVNRNLKLQNTFVLAASYFFYGWWDWRFLSLIFLSTISDFILGILIGKTDDQKIQKRYLYLSFVVNLGILIFFKYFNFFIEEFSRLSEAIGLNANYSTLSIILPIGISFYTFQTLSYTIDVYKKQLAPTNDFISFAAFVSFFPQLVAGPVERASTLLPQFLKKRQFDYTKSVEGCQQILWGFFKKIVIADNCALFVNDIFGYYEYGEVSGLILLIGAVLFVIQIYADFSGYSDIAIGVAKLFGFQLMQNFNFPYHATSTTEIWRKWHISISSWFRDYLNKPLFFYFRHWGNYGLIIPLILTFTIIGFWHGANWTFIVYGLIHGIVMSIELFSKKTRKKIRKKIPKWLNSSMGWLITMFIWVFTCIIFRAENMTLAVNYIAAIFDNLFVLDMTQVTSRIIFQSLLITLTKGKVLFLLILFMFVIEWIYRKYTYGFKLNFKIPFLNWVFYYSILLLIILFGEFSQQEFIYFQF